MFFAFISTRLFRNCSTEELAILEKESQCRQATRESKCKAAEFNAGTAGNPSSQESELTAYLTDPVDGECPQKKGKIAFNSERTQQENNIAITKIISFLKELKPRPNGDFCKTYSVNFSVQHELDTINQFFSQLKPAAAIGHQFLRCLRFKIVFYNTIVMECGIRIRPKNNFAHIFGFLPNQNLAGNKSSSDDIKNLIECIEAQADEMRNNPLLTRR